jgi:hypothetical protein
MPNFDASLWSELMGLIRNNDGEAVAARWFEFQQAGALEWREPEDALQRTALMIAYWDGNLSAAAALVRAGANYGDADSQGRSVTWYAQNFGKGIAEARMSDVIASSLRRMSMEETIRKTGVLGNPQDTSKRARRLSDEGGV